MKKAIMFGAGDAGRMLYKQIKSKYNVICATDNDNKKYGKELVPGVLILDKTVLISEDYDCVVISTFAGYEEVRQQLIEEIGIEEHKIDDQFVEPTINAKCLFLESFAALVYAKNINGDVCEAGVYRGGFAKEINRCFPDRNLYLFDKFGGGHDIRDIELEIQKGFSNVEVGSLSMTSEDIVLSKMPYPNKCIIKKGYFPETFDLDDEMFCFVNIDFDLYKPIKSALQLFYPRMSPGGVILVHDYMWAHLKGAAAAVNEFAAENGLGIVPIGDGVSVAIVKNL